MSDVDGTLTESENAEWSALLQGTQTEALGSPIRMAGAASRPTASFSRAAPAQPALCK